ncbi:MAG: hypothetical protein KDA27_09890 [Candidatus Eisenbacteria bacterium]|uniref:CopG-like ribbon-helix-helix domain-containing protein n=1 Tax=Eiseniibacteriota bacterium TaxID=2212470 RepID=A0A956NC52_UNCEI|nr:hypothetical protein [Candidatus Eisenbacteria bacterium]MCB9463775.1 hypothetical protein [Candidatus Eisenbacteria bacterium]
MAKKKAFALRIDPDLFEDLRRLADAEFRSVNGQIEYLLREAVDRRFGRRKDGLDGRSQPDSMPPPASDDGEEAD